MTAYQVMPHLTADEYTDLLDDIEANGIRVPIDVDEDGNILDGHHRAIIATQLGIDAPRRVLSGMSESEKIAHAYAVNLNRRSLNREQKRALVAASLTREPELSDRQHADRTGVSHPTVAAVREELEDEGRLESFTSRKGADGRVTKPQPSRPADWACHCGARFKAAHTHYETCGEHYPEPVHCPDHTIAVDTTTGEVLDGRAAPKSTPRRPLTDQFFDAAYDLSKVTERITRLAADDRFPQNAEKVAAKYRSDLIRAVDALQGVLHRLPSA